MRRDKINMLIAGIIVTKSWEKAFNQLEDKLLTKSLDRLIEHVELKEKELDKPSVDLFMLQEKVDNAFDFDVFELAKNLSGWQDDYKKLSHEYSKALNKIDESMKNTFEDIKAYQEAFDNELRLYTSTSEDINVNKLYARVQLSDKRLKAIIKTLKINKYEFTGEYDLLCDDLLTISRLVERKYKRHNAKMKELRKQLKKKEKEKYKKIFHYKELVKLAVSKGFEYIRADGDHLIYRNNKTQNIAIIPAHSQMKYGTMMNVQKMIFA